MEDLVRFHVFPADSFDENDSCNKGALFTGIMSFSEAKRLATEHYRAHHVPLIVTQTNPRRRGIWHNIRMKIG